MMSPDSVPREMIELMLENANWAPTHGLTEPWRFRIFQGESRQKLSDTLQRLYQEHTPRESFRP
ncbi:MAG: nitroreductase, partial [Verrucomicrobiales bacterium]